VSAPVATEDPEKEEEVVEKEEVASAKSEPQEEVKEEAAKEEEEEPVKSLFDPVEQKPALFKQASGTGLFGGVGPSETPSIFGGAVKPAEAGGLFGQVPKPEPGKLFGGESKTGGIFAASNSLFGSQTAAPGTGGLFGASAPSANLFAAPAAPTLFGNTAAPAGSLFGNAAPLFGGPAASLFGGGAVANGDEKKEDSEDDEVGKGGNSPPTYATADQASAGNGAFGQKIEKDPWTRRFDKKVDKFHIKVPKSLMKKMDNGNVSIEFTEANEKKIFILVFRSAMRKPLFTGHIGSDSRMKRVAAKASKNQLKVLVKHRPVNPPTGVKDMVYKTHVVCNFSSEADLVEFEGCMTQALEELKK